MNCQVCRRRLKVYWSRSVNGIVTWRYYKCPYCNTRYKSIDRLVLKNETKQDP